MQDCCDILKFPVAMRWLHRCDVSGRSAAWLARLVRDQEVEGSNPFAPTTLFLSCTYAFALQSCPVEFVAHVAQLSTNSVSETSGMTKPSPTFPAHSCRNSISSVSC